MILSAVMLMRPLSLRRCKNHVPSFTFFSWADVFCEEGFGACEGFRLVWDCWDVDNLVAGGWWIHNRVEHLSYLPVVFVWFFAVR